jgi:hypothetical protein
MKKKVELGKTYIGVVEDIKDPQKMGRVKARVLDIYDDQKLEDIPWAAPWKDLGGGQFSLPEIGKVVIVVFDQADVYKPEYIFTEHWNVNLENKLKSLSDTDYQSMRSLIFDHKTQIFVNDSEGLKIDHKFNNINIKDNSINLNLKDNNMVLNLGDSAANQQMILGTHFMKWFDEFLDCFTSNTALIGNLGAPAIVGPKLIGVISKYKSTRDTHLLSQHVNIIDNNQSSTVKSETREETAQAGDTWQSTVKENTLTTTSDETNKPTDGIKPSFDSSFAEPPAIPGLSASLPIPQKLFDSLPDKGSILSNPKIEKFVWFMKDKGYKLYDKPYELNILAFRNKEKVYIQKLGIKKSLPAPVSNKFDDELHLFFKNENNAWEHFEYAITTVPGFVPGQNVLPKNVPILRLGQYVEQLSMTDFGGDPNHKCLSFDTCAIHKNTSLDSYDYESPTELGNFPLSIHRTTDPAQSEFVFNYSEGSQVFKSVIQYESFIKVCQKQVEIAKKEKFTYTLSFKSEFDKYPNPDKLREKLQSKIPGLSDKANNLTKNLEGSIDKNISDLQRKGGDLTSNLQQQGKDLASNITSQVDVKSLESKASGMLPEISMDKMIGSIKGFSQQGFETPKGAPSLDQLIASGKKLNISNTFGWAGQDQLQAEVDLEKNLSQQIQSGKSNISQDGVKIFKTIKTDDPEYSKIIESFGLKNIKGDFVQSIFIPFL